MFGLSWRRALFGLLLMLGVGATLTVAACKSRPDQADCAAGCKNMFAVLGDEAVARYTLDGQKPLEPSVAGEIRQQLGALEEQCRQVCADAGTIERMRCLAQSKSSAALKACP